jgi:chromosome segregation ATPase
MYFVLGVLAAGLLALAVTPAIWRRAIRLTQARIESAVPLSLAEIQADKDQLRAEFAVSNRRLELSVGRLEERAAGHAVEVNRYRLDVARLESERAARAETIRTLEGRVAELDRTVQVADGRIAEARAELAARDKTLAERAARLKELEGELIGSQQLTVEQKFELVARDTEIGNLKDQLAASRAAEASVAKRRDEVAGELDAERQLLAAERRRAEQLEARIHAFETERTDRLALLDRRVGEIKALEAEIAADRATREALAATVERLEAERETGMNDLARMAGEMASLRAAIAEASVSRRRTDERLIETEAALAAAAAEIAGLRVRAEGDAMAAGDNLRKAIAANEDENRKLAARLEVLETENAGLRAENQALLAKQAPEWEVQAAENARLREAISGIASEIVAMAGNGAKPAQPHRAAKGANGNGDARRATQDPAPAEAPESPASPPGEPRSLAERIRALQHAGARH